jgi:hypothetical protein
MVRGVDFIGVQAKFAVLRRRKRTFDLERQIHSLVDRALLDDSGPVDAHGDVFDGRASLG